LRKIEDLEAKIRTEKVRYQGYLTAIDQADGSEIERIRADEQHQIQNLENILIEFTFLEAKLMMKRVSLFREFFGI
jgi:hypothetical protein